MGLNSEKELSLVPFSFKKKSVSVSPSLKYNLVSATNDEDDGHEEAVVAHVDVHRNDVREKVDAKEYGCHIVGDNLTLRSSLRTVDSKKENKKVQWVDVMGIKELAEIREFEPSEEDDDIEEKNCVCVIL